MLAKPFVIATFDADAADDVDACFSFSSAETKINQDEAYEPTGITDPKLQYRLDSIPELRSR